MKKINTFLLVLSLAFGVLSGSASALHIYFERPDDWTGTPRLYLYNSELWGWGDSPFAAHKNGNLYEFDFEDDRYDPDNTSYSYIIWDSDGDSRRVEKPGFVDGYVYNGDGMTPTRIEDYVTTVTRQPAVYMTGLGDRWIIGDGMIEIPHVGNGVYSRRFTPMGDNYSGAQIFKISKNKTPDWTEFDNGVIQPENCELINETQPFTVGFNGNNISIPNARSFIVTVDMDAMTMRVDVENDAKMPLSRADFADGKKHYFIIGTRTNDFRLQPEWELTAENGYRISDRLFYPGMFAVAVVDSYDEYIYHRFRMYADIDANGNGLVVGKDNLTGIALSDRGYASCITTDDYKAYNRPYNYVNDGSSKVVMIFDWNYSDDKADLILNGLPILAGEIALTLDDSGTPVSLSFNNCTDDKSSVADRRMFAPCGAKIYYADSNVYNPALGTTWWWNNDQQFHQTEAWANSWIQYDKDYEPYIDGNGQYLAQTVFQYSTWMKRHPSIFEYPEVGDMKRIPYTSNNIVFVHYTQIDETDPYYSYYLSKADKGVPVRIGADELRQGEGSDAPYVQNPWNYKEQLWSFADDGVTPVYLGDEAFRESSHWEPYVVSDIWLYGEFKIWSGTGGGPRYQARATVRNEGIDTDYLWYPENGGVDLNRNTAGSVNPTYIYNNADEPTVGQMFSVGKWDSFNNFNFKDAPKYFKRVILWYDADKGIGNSVIQFLGRYFAPTITASRVEGEDKLRYHWTIPIEESAAGKANLMEYRIARYRIDENGAPQFHGYATDADGRYTSVGKLISDMHRDNDFENIHSGVDNTVLPTGIYFYTVYANIEDNTNGVARDLKREASSNRVSFVASGTQTGVDAVSSDNLSAEKIYYDLRGVRVDNPSGGMFIEVIGTDARKVIL